MTIKAASNASLASVSLSDCEKNLAPVKSNERAVSWPQEAEPVWLVKARTFARQREPDKAMQLLLTFVRADPQNILAWRELARLLDGAGRRETALSAWDQVLAFAPNDAEAVTASGLNLLALKKFSSAAQKFLLARRLWLTVEPTKSRLKMQIATTAGLGLALRQLNYSLAAATCFHEATQFEIALIADWVADEKIPRRQSKEFLRFAGECEASIGQWDNAAASFSQSLVQANTSDATSLSALVWALTAAGRPDDARQVIMDTLAKPDSPGREGAPSAVQWLAKNGLAQPLQQGVQQIANAHDVTIARCMLACADEHAVEFIFKSAPQVLDDPIAMRETAQWIAARQGVGAVVQLALQHVQTDPATASRWAAALRALPISAKQLRGDIQNPIENNSIATNSVANVSLNNATRALLCAWVDLLGFDSLLALNTIEPFTKLKDAIGGAARIVALKALITEQNLTMVERVELLCDATSCEESAALAQVFLAFGEIEKSIVYAERGITLNKKCFQAWLARSAIDLEQALRQDIVQTYEQKKEAALEARNSLERALLIAPNDRLVARKYLEISAIDRGIAPDEDAMEIVQKMKSNQVQREYRRETALLLQRQSQSEIALESLRFLFMEDPLDVTVGQALVAAAGDTARLPETEKFLDDLLLSHPAVAEIGEANLSTKARQDRLVEAIEILKAAAAADPDSDALLRGYVRTLAATGKNNEAWSAILNSSKLHQKAAGRSQLERIDFALTCDPNAAAQEIRDLSTNMRLSQLQRKSAVSMAHQLPKNIDDRLALQAVLSKPLLDNANVEPLYVAYVMMDGSLENARAISKKYARAWGVSNTIEAAQVLVDDAMFMRGESLLHDVGALSKDKSKSQLFRAELACLIAKGNVQKAIMRLNHERERNQFRIKDPRVTSEAEDLAELGNAFLMASDPAAAEECFQAAIDLAPDLTAALNNLGWLRMERNDIDLITVDVVRRALAATPNDPSILDTAGWLAYRQGRINDEPELPGALTLLQKSVALANERPSLESLDHLADALFRAGKTENALRIWRMIVDQDLNKSSRGNVINAFQILQQKEWGIRAWDAAKFYERNDGAAIARANQKLKAVEQSRAPELAEMDFANISQATTVETLTHQESAPLPQGNK